MKLRMPGPDTMDKIIVGVAIVGAVIAGVTVYAIPSPEEFHARSRTMFNDLSDLNTMVQGAVSRGEYQLACELQKTTTEIMLKNNVEDDLLDMSLDIEETVCTMAKKNFI